MKDDQIKAMIDRYFLGETSLEEERQLASALRKEELPADLMPYRELFDHRAQISRAEPGPDFDQGLLTAIQKEEGNPRRSTLRLRAMPILAIAASLALLIAVGLWWQSQPSVGKQTAIDWSRYEPQSPEAAYSVTRQALHTVAGTLKEGSQKAREEVKKLNILTKALQ